MAARASVGIFLMLVLALNGCAAKIKDEIRLVSEDVFAKLYILTKNQALDVRASDGNPILGKPGRTGTGIAWTKDGFILTNAHVVQGMKNLRICFEESDCVEASLVGMDTEMDVALLKLNSDRALVPAVIGDSSKVRVGDDAYAIGNPLGFKRSLTRGVISGIERTLDKGIQIMFQTDAALNQGNSGGPLFNIRGEVIGMNVRMLNPSLSNSVGFSIPINDVIFVADMLKSEGKARYGSLGVGIISMERVKTEALAGQLGLAWPLPVSSGLYVQKVLDGTAAAKAGVRAGDIITHLNGTPMPDGSVFRRNISKTAPGTEIRLVILRNGKEIKLRAILGERAPMSVAELSEEDDDDAPLEKRKMPKLPEGLGHLNFGQAPLLLPSVVREEVLRRQGLVTFTLIGDDGQPTIVLKVGGVLIDKERVVSVAPFNFFEEIVKTSSELKISFNGIAMNSERGMLLNRVGQAGVFSFVLEKPYPGDISAFSLVSKPEFGEKYWTLIINDLTVGDSLAMYVPVVNVLDIPAVNEANKHIYVFGPILAQLSGLGAPIWNQNGAFVGVWLGGKNASMPISYALSAQDIAEVIKAAEGKENKQ